MPVSAKPSEELSTEDIERLVENSMQESLSLEFKQEPYERTTPGKKEFLKDVSALANKDGGDIVIGVSDIKGRASGIKPISNHCIDEQSQWMESLLRDCLEPRLSGHKITPVAIDTDHSVLVLRVPSSWSKPHRVTIGGSNKFHIRNSSGVHEMGVEELRTAFVAGDTRIERIRSFVEKKIGQIEQQIESGIYFGQGVIALHVISVTDFETKQDLDYSLLDASPGLCLPTGYGGGVTLRPNLDGFFGEFQTENKVRARGQIYRSGLIEMVDSGHRHQITGAICDQFHGDNATGRMVRNAERSIKSLGSLSRSSPFIVLTNLLGFQDVEWYLDPMSSSSMIDHVSDRHRMALPNVVVEKFVDESDLAKQLKPMLDAFWNGFGFNSCAHFDADGNWNPPLT